MAKKEKLLQIYLNKKEKIKRREALLAELKEYIRPKEKQKPINFAKKAKYEAIKKERINKIKDEVNKTSDANFVNENNAKIKNPSNDYLCNLPKKRSETNTMHDYRGYQQSINKTEETVDCIGKILYNDYLSTMKSTEENINQNSDCNNNKNIKDTLPIESIMQPDNIMKDICDTKVKTERKIIKRKNHIEEARQTLPIYYDEMTIIDAIKSHDVVFIAGDTGSGKSTQIPQFIYENLSMENMMIGMTQPRRISAISLSKRINEELNSQTSSYKIRYEDTTTNKTGIKIMTEGVILNEIRKDLLLTKYSHIILDEIHEQSAVLEIVMILLSRIIKIRNRMGSFLKLILMSATFECEKLNSLFEKEIFKIKIEKQCHKVSIFYEKETKEHYFDLIVEKIKFILALETQENENEFNYKVGIGTYKSENFKLPKGVKNDESSAILIFLPGKREISCMIEKLKEENLNLNLISLHSMLPQSVQNLIYEKSKMRKVILATNIAETSITVPDVVFVIDSGRRKYKIVDQSNFNSYTTKFVSKASANQRAGRAGRVSNGICFRLYSGKFFSQLRDYETPEIENISLENIILTLLTLGIKDIHSFPFISRPSKLMIDNGLNLLCDLGAVENRNLTEVGIKMLNYPIDTRLSRILVIDTHLRNELALLVSIISFDFELNNLGTCDIKTYKSELIAKMSVMLEYINSSNRESFAIKNKVSRHQFNEILKLFRFIRRINAQESNFIIKDLTRENTLDLRKIIYGAFCDNLVVRNGNEYFYDGKSVFLPNLSSYETGSQFVFTHMECSKGKYYVKNVTCVDDVTDE